MNTTIVSPIKQVPKISQVELSELKQESSYPDKPKIYTSYYAGKQIGKSISISLTKPDWCKFEHKPEFAPSRELLDFWNNSNKGAKAIAYYTKVYLADMAAKDKEIDDWLTTIKESTTLNCYEVDQPNYVDNPFCHRHLFGQIIKRKRPDLWGGEVNYVIFEHPVLEPKDIGFKEGDKIKYFWPKEKLWLDATFKGVHTTSFAKSGQFSFIEVIVKGHTLKAFSLSQIKSA